MVSVVILALQTVLQSQVMRTSPECRLILAILIEVLCSMTSLHPIRPKKSLKNRKNQKSLEGQKENSGISTPKIHLTVKLSIKTFPMNKIFPSNNQKTIGGHSGALAGCCSCADGETTHSLRFLPIYVILCAFI